jgi:hypothetical protein
MTEGYYLCRRDTREVLHGPYPQLTHAFAHYIRGQTVVMHRRRSGEFNLVST